MFQQTVLLRWGKDLGRLIQRLQFAPSSRRHCKSLYPSAGPFESRHLPGRYCRQFYLVDTTLTTPWIG
jgi:hypothetical protein